MRQTLSLLFFLLSGLILAAQTPQSLNYQAVARNSTGQIIPSQSIGVRFSILESSVNGTEIYKETHITTTNSFGLFTLSIGSGTAVTGTFSTIDWASGTKFLKVEISPAGGTSYTIQGTTQFLSVPYALYSEKTKLLAGNNTVTISNGNTITGNYQPANNTIAINGNSISGNYQAGPGISISGNTISSSAGPGGGLWVTDASGQHSVPNRVGIGMNSDPIAVLSLNQPNLGIGGAGLHIKSDDTWHTAMTMFSNPIPNSHYSLLIGGPNNTDIHPGNFAILNHNTSSYILHATRTTNFVGIGSGNPSIPARSRLHVFNGDINIEQIGSGVILKSPNGQCWRVTIDNAGNLVRTTITCP